jgi:uncharacterized secreted protein with C-terminal beta-propeller domain
VRLTARRLARIGFLTAAALGATFAGLATTGADVGQSKAAPVRAAAFRSCDGLVDYAQRQALQMVDLRRTAGPGPVPMPLIAPMPAAGPEGDSRAAPVSQPGIDHSTTNVQEAGVDEPDIVKTDGSRIFSIVGEKLHAVDASGHTPRLVGSISLKANSDALLLRGDRLLVISRASSYAEPQPLGQGPQAMRAGPVVQPARYDTLLTEVDVRNPAAMRVVRTLSIDGRYVDGRLNGGTARIVIGSNPRALEPPIGALSPKIADDAQGRLMHAGIRRWLPSYVLHNRRTGRTARHRLVRCKAVRHAVEFSGLDLLTVLTIDLDKGLPPIDSDAVMTDADTVYASSRSLYIATQRWLDPALTEQAAPQTTTAIHKFDITEPDRTSYRASGEVPGFLLNQFSLSEYKGFLRVASTEQPSWWGGGPPRRSESFVTVLDERAGKLLEVGRVAGLGRGEQIYAVRFIDDAGYVVTFRQTDPLYTLDLSRADQPRVLGELKILGYSAYLHPVGKDLLIGVGQDATEQGRRLGTQISLFDVSDLSRPVRIHSRAVGGMSSSQAEYDHHAFLYWPPTKLAVLPIDVYRAASVPFTGAIGFRIDREAGIDEVGRVSHDEGVQSPDRIGAGIRRALVVGNELYTVSDRGIEASSLGTLAKLAWVPFD